MHQQVPVIADNKGVTANTYFIWQSELPNVVDWHVRAGNPQKNGRRGLVVLVRLAVKRWYCNGC